MRTKNKNKKIKQMKKRAPRKFKVWNVNLQNFLGERGIWPLREDPIENVAIYVYTKELEAAMESYFIRQIVYNGHKQ